MKYRSRVLLAACFIAVTASSLVSGAALKVNDGIIKSPYDKKEYRMLTLPNQLKALLISDPTTERSSAALAVQVGYCYDPDELPGLAHFLEHLLFMGTAKYPDEAEYSAYLSAHAGSSNAYTDTQTTNYFFDVGADYLDPALDRFAQFFIAPLFNEGGVERELLAIESEHKKNLQDDGWRARQVESLLSNPHCPSSKFGTGNLETLRDIPKTMNIDTRGKLLEFYRKHYSADVMSLVVFGRESLDELQAMVNEKFNLVPNHAQFTPVTDWNCTPFSDGPEKYIGQLIRVKSVQGKSELKLTWLMPDIAELREQLPLDLICHFLGHEGKGSLTSFLKGKGWVSGLMAADLERISGFSYVIIKCKLTDEGKSHVEDIIRAVFEYLILIKQNGISEWAQEERYNLAKNRFYFKETGDPTELTSEIAARMNLYSEDRILVGPTLPSGPISDNELNRLLHLLSWDNFRALLLTDDPFHESSAVQEEHHYGTEFTVEALSPELLKYIQNPQTNDALSLPQANPFIAKDYSLHPIEDDTTEPTVIHESNQYKLWFKQDRTFGIPKANILIAIRNPRVGVTAEDSARLGLLKSMMNEWLNEELYDAKLAGLSFNIGVSHKAFTLHFGGYNDKLPEFIDFVIGKLLAFRADPKALEPLIEKNIRSLKNLNKMAPFEQLRFFRRGLAELGYSWPDEQLPVFYTIRPSDIDLEAQRVFTEGFIECLCHGNIMKHQAQDILQMVKNRFSNLEMLQDTRHMLSFPLLPTEKTLYLIPPALNNPNNAISLVLQTGLHSDLEHLAMTLVTEKLFEGPFFETLRTKEQLGYVVRLGQVEFGRGSSLCFIIQSEKSPEYLEQRINTFIDSMPKILNDIPQSVFDDTVKSAANYLLEKYSSLTEETISYWNKIESMTYDFDRAKRLAAIVSSSQVNKESIRQFIEEHVLIGGHKRKALIMQLWSTKLNGDRTEYIAKLQGEPKKAVFEHPKELAQQLAFIERIIHPVQ